MTYQIPKYGSFEEWEKWEHDSETQYPVLHFLRWRLPILWSRFCRVCFRDPWCWLKCAAWQRHNVLVLRDLPVTWTDRDTRLLHACFQLLKDFVELEKPFEHFDTEHSHNAAAWVEIGTLYAWWEVRRTAETDDCLFGDEQHNKDNEMLCRLIAVRKHLWT